MKEGGAKGRGERRGWRVEGGGSGVGGSRWRREMEVWGEGVERRGGEEESTKTSRLFLAILLV